MRARDRKRQLSDSLAQLGCKENANEITHHGNDGREVWQLHSGELWNIELRHIDLTKRGQTLRQRLGHSASQRLNQFLPTLNRGVQPIAATPGVVGDMGRSRKYGDRVQPCISNRERFF